MGNPINIPKSVDYSISSVKEYSKELELSQDYV